MKSVNVVLLAGFILVSPMLAPGQDEERIQKLFQDAIQAMGGDAYLGVKDIVSVGNLFQFTRDASYGPFKVDDYAKLPDRRRNEVGNKKKERNVIVFNLEKNEGWIQDGQKETRVATPEEMKEFRDSIKHNLNNIFLYRFKDPKINQFYLGPGEGSDVQFDLVKLLDEDNDEVTVYFDRVGKLPAKIEYRTIGKNDVRQRIVKEYSQWHSSQGINTPLRTDTYRNGAKYMQLYITKITYNSGLQDSFFTKPEPQK